MTENPLRLALLQLTSSDDPFSNLNEILKTLKVLDSKSLDLVCLPENCLYQRIDRASPAFALKGAGDPLLGPLKEWALENETALLLGGVSTEVGGGLPTNSFWWISSSGEPQNVYSKVHLFDVDVEGEPAVRESQNFSSGAKASLVEYGGVNYGPTICYDIRFPELYQSLVGAGSQVLFVPASFLPGTGRAHWLTLLRARAIETQCFVVAPAQGGVHRGAGGGERKTWGQSAIIDPWGGVLEVLPSLDELEGGAPERRVAVVSLELSQLRKVRSQIPLSRHKKPKEFFSRVEKISL